MKEGSRDAFNEIYARYSIKLFAEAFKRIRSEDDAKDMVQDLFISLWLKREVLVIRKSLGAYLFTSVKHKVLNFISSSVTRADYIDSLAAVIEDYDSSPDEKIISDDLQHFIDQRIDDLSPRVKEVFLLSRNENLSVKEIASKLKVSDQTVKNQLSKALKDLRVYIGGTSSTLSFLASLSCIL